MVKKNDSNTEEEIQQKMTPEIQKSIDDIIYQKKSIARDQEALKEALTAVAERLGIKAGVLNSRISLIIKEEEKGGEVKSKENDIQFVEDYFNLKNNSNN